MVNSPFNDHSLSLAHHSPALTHAILMIDSTFFSLECADLEHLELNWVHERESPSLKN